MTSTRHSLVDISDLPADTPPGVKSFISTVRLGYSTKKGTFEGWRRAIRRIAKHAPVIHFTTAVAVGALMRPLLRDMPGGILYLQGASTTGKSIALRTALSLRADPSDMTWGFDSMATLKWYTVAAEHNFLCLDDIHMAILPDNDSGRPVSSAYLLGFDHWEQSPHTTILATGIPNLRALAGKHLEQAVEIDAQQLPLWPTPAGMSPWWMDEPLSELRVHYGRAHDRIGDSISKDADYWTEQYQMNMEQLTPRIPLPGQRALFVQASLGLQWLESHAGVKSDFTVHNALLSKYASD